MKNSSRGESGRSPWLWIPSLYFAEGVPYFAVNMLAVLLYTQMGVPVAKMAFFTSLLSLPWVIKPFWAPFVDIIGTKRGWVLAMQAGIAAAMGAVVLLLPLPSFFALTLAVFMAMAFLSATHDVAADGYYMLALTHHQQASYSGLRNTFYRVASLFSQGALVGLSGVLIAAGFEVSRAWMAVFALMSGIFLCIMLYNSFAMPKPRQDASAGKRTADEIVRDFLRTFVTFFTKKNILAALAFMLLYRLPEALLTKLTMPFFKASTAQGGLALSNEEIGVAYGTVGVISLLAGGIIGGVAIGAGGLKKWLWPMALSLTIPSAFYCYLAMSQPQNLWIISIGIGLEQFGYGFGFTAFMLYLIYFSEGEYKTSHYAFCTGIMALGMMLPGMAAGWIYDRLAGLVIFTSDSNAPQGYVNFFWFMMLCSLATFAVCSIVKIPADFGKKRKTAKHPFNTLSATSAVLKPSQDSTCFAPRAKNPCFRPPATNTSGNSRYQSPYIKAKI